MSKSARALHNNLRIVEQADDITTDHQNELRKILFKKTTVVMGGLQRQYCATLIETRLAIKNLLKIRRDFMADRGLHDAQPPSGGASQPADHRYVFTQEDRKQVMQEWKDRFHAMRDQVEQQMRDSWKPDGPPPDAHDAWGPNRQAVRSGKHSRFARHLQLVAGSKTMAELIIYTGRFDPEFLNKAHEAQDRNGASQPVASADRQKALKKKSSTGQVGLPHDLHAAPKIGSGPGLLLRPRALGARKASTAGRRLPASPHERCGGRVWPRDAAPGRRRNNRNRWLHWGDHALPPGRVRRARRRLLLAQALRGELNAAVLLSLR